ncbi:MAG TPA: trehalose-phosphatase [Acidimicrobiales bacterium]|nr:trehalose-phosphatase [Acidimicrobiales bacterium]
MLCDFDGTLSPIVEDPARAEALPGAVEVLHRLADRLDVVAVVSGRPADFLASRLFELEQPTGPSASSATSLLRAFGLYGMEEVETAGSPGGLLDPALDGWRDAVEEAARTIEPSMPAGTLVERKGLTLGLHWRHAPDEEATVLALAAATAARHGLTVRRGRMAAELVPPLPFDKGVVVGALTAGLRAGCFCGDDLGDLPAFDALDRRAATGDFLALKVAAASPESPAELIERADVVVEGPSGALELLRALERSVDPGRHGPG